MAAGLDDPADHETGGRPDSRRARAVMSLTYRDLQFGPPPDERSVVVGYLDTTGKSARCGWTGAWSSRARPPLRSVSTTAPI